MKAKEIRAAQKAAKQRARMNRVDEAVSKLNELDTMLLSGLKVVRGKRHFVSVADLREQALDELTALAHAAFSTVSTAA